MGHVQQRYIPCLSILETVKAKSLTELPSFTKPITPFLLHTVAVSNSLTHSNRCAFSSLDIPITILLCLKLKQTFTLGTPSYLNTSFLFSHKIYNDKQLQYKSKGSMEIHNSPKTYSKHRDTNITKIVTQYLAIKIIGVVLPVVPLALQIWINFTKSYFKGESKSTYAPCY